MKNFRLKYVWWFGGMVLFLVVAFYLYSPLLEGKKLMGSDSLQFLAMEQERIHYKETHGEETYWTNAVFGGMPTYLLGAGFPASLPAHVDKVLKFFPRPVNYLFLYFLGFVLLGMVLRIDLKKALVGAFGFALSTYLVIILQVGHFAKAGAIAYMPWILAAVLLILERKKYATGFVLLALSMGLELHAKHYQMTYYMGMALLLLGAVYAYEAIRSGEWKILLKEVVLMLGAVLIGIGLNWTEMAAIKQYISQSIRGEQFITLNPDGSPKVKEEGLDKNYITEYSYGIAETFDLFIPGFMGGSNREKLDESSHLYKALKGKTDRRTAKQFVESTSLYWGNQPIVMAPAYIGAVILFLAFIGFMLYRGKLKIWILITSVLVLLLSWGKNFPWLTNLMIDYFPYYDKFRVVASIQVVLEVLMPLMAILGLLAFFDNSISREEKMKALKTGVYLLGGIALFFGILGPSLFDFESSSDAIYKQYGLLDALIADRQRLMRTDSIRSLIFVLLTAAVLVLMLQNKLKTAYGFVLLILLVIFDLAGVSARYIRQDDFMTSREIQAIFAKTPVDEAILKDKSYYRVINLARNPLTDGLTSYYHKNLGGYHAAKPRRIQDLFDFYLNGKLHFPVLNMYNVKYIIFKGRKGLTYQQNDGVSGPAWFVSDIQYVPDQNAEISALKNFNPATTAVTSDTGLSDYEIAVDSTAHISLESYAPNRLVYHSESQRDGLAVFAENYYPFGWKSYIDNKPAKIYRVNYSLRAMKIPSGKHKIVMEFDPDVIRKGVKISYIFVLLFVLSIFYWIFRLYKSRQVK